jgi:hypothetical protein
MSFAPTHSSDLPLDWFAAKFESRELNREYLRRTFTVELGYEAMIVEDGDPRPRLSPKNYTLESLLDWAWSLLGGKRQCTLVLVRSEEQSIDFQVAATRTRENVGGSVTVTALVQIADVPVFARNALGNRTCLTRTDLDAFVKSVLEEHVRRAIHDGPLDRVAPDATAWLDGALAVDARNELQDRYGLRLVAVRQARFHNSAVEQIHDGIGDAHLGAITRQTENNGKIAALEAEVAFRGPSDALADQLRQLDTTKVERETLDRIERVAVYERLHRALTDAKRNRLIDQGAWDQLVDETDTRRLLRSHERMRLGQIHELALRDAEAAARMASDLAQAEFRQAKLSLENAAEMERSLRTATTGGEIAKLRTDQRERETQLELQLYRERAELYLDIDRRRKEFDEQARRNDIQTKRIADDAKIAHLRGLAEISTNIARENAKIKQETEERSKRLEADLLSQNVQAVKGADPLALLVAAPPERATILANVLKNQQDQSAHVKIAEASAEGAANAARAEVHGEHIQGLRRMASERGAEHQQTLGTVADLAARGMESVARATQGQPGPNATPPATKALICTQCRTENPETARHCASCGRSL